MKYGINFKKQFLEEARYLHQKYPVADAHFDIPAEIMVRYQRGEREIIKRNYLEQWKRAGMKIIIASVFLNNQQAREAPLRITLTQITYLTRELENLGDEIVLIKNKDSLDEVLLSQDKIGLILYLEGLDCLGEDVGLLHILYHLGVRGAALTWNRRNALAAGCILPDTDRNCGYGITKTGLLVIREMSKMNMFLDISHLHRDGVQTLVEENIKINVLATHSNLFELNQHQRNLSSAELEFLKKNNGLIGINANRFLIGGELPKMLEHLKLACAQLGSTKVALGLDLCDGYGNMNEHAPEDILRRYEDIVYITAGMLQEGMERETIRRVMGENLILFLKRIFDNRENILEK